MDIRTIRAVILGVVTAVVWGLYFISQNYVNGEVRLAVTTVIIFLTACVPWFFCLYELIFNRGRVPLNILDIAAGKPQAKFGIPVTKQALFITICMILLSRPLIGTIKTLPRDFAGQLLFWGFMLPGFFSLVLTRTISMYRYGINRLRYILRGSAGLNEIDDKTLLEKYIPVNKKIEKLSLLMYLATFLTVLAFVIIALLYLPAGSLDKYAGALFLYACFGILLAETFFLILKFLSNQEIFIAALVSRSSDGSFYDEKGRLLDMLTQQYRSVIRVSLLFFLAFAAWLCMLFSSVFAKG